MVSIPLSAFSSGKIKGNSFDLSNNIKPVEGFEDATILFSSSMIRSFEMISIRLRFRSIAEKVSFSIENPNWVANRMARIMRNGSSLNVISGSKGVRIIPAFRSSIPLNGSINSPKCSLFKQIANAFIVKSLRF